MQCYPIQLVIWDVYNEKWASLKDKFNCGKMGWKSWSIIVIIFSSQTMNATDLDKPILEGVQLQHMYPYLHHVSLIYICFGQQYIWLPNIA